MQLDQVETETMATVADVSGQFYAECVICPWVGDDHDAHVFALIDAAAHNLRRHEDLTTTAVDPLLTPDEGRGAGPHSDRRPEEGPSPDAPVLPDHPNGQEQTPPSELTERDRSGRDS